MMIVWLLLGACFSVGLSYDEEVYGGTFRMRLHRQAQSIEFTPVQLYNSDVKILWKRNDLPASKDGRMGVTGSYYVIHNLTQEDSGRYIIRDSDRLALFVKSIHVKAHTMSYVKSYGETVAFTFKLAPGSCNIYFYPENYHQVEETKLVSHGKLQYVDHLNCDAFDLVRPCGIRNYRLQMSCSGRFEFRDSNGNVALEVSLEVDSYEHGTTEIGVGIGVFFIVIFGSTCARCCCGKSAKKDASETPNTDPAVHYQENENEPVGQRPEQLRPSPGTRYLTQAFRTPTSPLIHNPPNFTNPTNPTNPPSVPPPYSEVSAPADAPTFPIHSDSGPRFELKGMDFSSAYPLGSESTCSDVYNSDKLNFL